MADGGYGPCGRGGWGGHGGAPPPMGGVGGWGYGGYQAPHDVGNRNWAETGNNEIRVGNNTVPGASIGNNNRAHGNNIVTVGDNAPGGYGPGGYGYDIHYFRVGLPY